MNATEELRRLLDERGIHWWAGVDECKTLWESNGLTWEYFNYENGHTWFGFLSACEQDITPEQAIAATLGGVGSKVGSKVGSEVCVGKLTAEQVEPIVDRNCKWYEGGEIDAQAIADELNATLSGGECEIEI